MCISIGYLDEKVVLNIYRSIKQELDKYTHWYE
jgi:hypothetical protein